MNTHALFPKKDVLSIPVTAENRSRLDACRNAISEAEPFEALNELKAIGLDTLDTECNYLEARLNHLDNQDIRGLLSGEEEQRELNRIHASILSLVQRLEHSFEQDENNYRTLRAYLQLRYAGRLRQKLGERQPINIRRFYSTVGTTPIGAAAYKDVVVPDTEVRQTMLETFDAADGRLLVVGHPGVGKTTLLLQLALALLEQRPDHIAAVLNLATWQSEFGSFDTWLDRILPLELGVSRALANKIRQNPSFILLLDGLDEVPADDRDSSLQAIGRYGTEAQNKFVISSRIDEYSNASKDAPVNMQIEMRPLTAEQIETELASAGPDRPEAMRLQVALRHDQFLREAVATPFYLNTAQILFAQGRNWDEMGFIATDLEGRKRELVESFVENSLQSTAKRIYPPQKARKWLSFLAQKMNKENIAAFELIHLRPVWMPRRIYLFYAIFSVVNGFGSGLFGILVTIIAGLGKPDSQGENDLNPWLFTGLLIGLGIIVSFIAILIKHEIRTEEVSTWSWKHFRQNWGVGLSFLILGVLNLFYASSGLDFLVSGIMFLAGGLAAGYKKTALLQIDKPYQRFTASFRNGVFPIIMHACLRLAFYLEGSLPLRLVNFLNEMSARHLLESDGGSWRFRHKILLDYFVQEMAENPTSRKSLK